jgi:hypothetical protein
MGTAGIQNAQSPVFIFLTYGQVFVVIDHVVMLSGINKYILNIKMCIGTKVYMAIFDLLVVEI